MSRRRRLCGAVALDEAGLRPNPYMSGPPDPEQIALCREWIRRFASPRATINRRHGSYSLKHRVERWCGRYVSNGAFIAAALAEGYCLEPSGLNAHFNMTVPRNEETHRKDHTT